MARAPISSWVISLTTPRSQRTQSVRDALSTDQCKFIEVIDAQQAGWLRTTAMDLMTNWLTAGEPFDAVFANNDEMAIGAIQAMKSAGVDMTKVIVVGVDATQDGLAEMQAGGLRCKDWRGPCDGLTLPASSGVEAEQTVDEANLAPAPHRVDPEA